MEKLNVVQSVTLMTYHDLHIMNDLEKQTSCKNTVEATYIEPKERSNLAANFKYGL